jgi:SAM-dependent methyltransferase
MKSRWLDWGGRIVRQLMKLPVQFRALKSNARFDLQLLNLNIQLADAVRQTPFDRHYIYHTAWAVRVLAESQDLMMHVDIGSSLYFVGAASALLPVSFFDFRPAELSLDGLSSAQADLSRLSWADNSVDSLSCMHVIEHVGLGRYGDPFNPDGDLGAVSELKRVVAPDGQLLIVLPLAARARIDFNAHRVYAYQQVLEMFDGFKLVEFALIPDDARIGGLLRHACPELVATQRYACGCFHFRKVAT